MEAAIIGTASATIDPSPAGSAILHDIPVAHGRGAAEPPARDSAVRLAQNDTDENVKSTGNPSVAPLKWVGFLKNPTPTKKQPVAYDYCTGQFIAANVVLTAAHCLNDHATGTVYDLTKQTFVLQYQNGVGSQTFKTLCGATSPQWALPSNFASMTQAEKSAALMTAQQHDFAMILVDGNSPTGFMPYELDWKGKVTRAVRVGYAIDILNGEIVQQAGGNVFFPDDVSLFAPASMPNLVAHWAALTDLTQGISGGAWIAHFSTTEGANHNALIAVTSFNSPKYPGAVFGAYLTAAEFNPLLAYVSNGCK